MAKGVPKLTGSKSALELNQDQRRMLRLVESNAYEGLAAVIICYTAFIIIQDTDQRAAGEDQPAWVNASNWFLMVFYLVDILLRLFAYQKFFFSSRWNLLDLFLVISDIIFKIVEMVSGGAPSFAILRLCKIFRVMRFARVISVFKELHMMLAGFVSAMKALLWASLMLLIMLTFWSILAVEIVHPVNKRLADLNVYEGCERCPRAFSSVMQSNLTFLQQIIAGDSWGQVSVPVIEEQPLTAVFFFAVLLTVNFGLLNLVLTVIVDSAQAARDADEQRRLADKTNDFKSAKKKLMKVCEDLDKDGSGELTYAELMDGLDHHTEFADSMALMDVNKQDMNVVFDMLDQDNSGSVTFVEFVEQLHKMKTQDDHTMLIFIRGYVNEVRKKVAEQLRYTREETGSVTRQTLATCRDLKDVMNSMVTGTVISTNGTAQPLPLAVSIAGTKGLHETRNLSSNGSAPTNSHTFCVCEVEGKPQARVQTPTLVAIKDPHWNYEGTLDGYVQGDSLVFTVWDKTHMNHEMLGQAVLSSEELRQSASGFDGKVPLRRAGETFASLEVKVRGTPGRLQQNPEVARVEALPVSLQSISEDIKLLFRRLDGEFSQPWATGLNGHVRAPSGLPQPGSVHGHIRAPSGLPQADSVRQPSAGAFQKADSRSTSAIFTARTSSPGGYESPCPCCKVSQDGLGQTQIRPAPMQGLGLAQIQPAPMQGLGQAQIRPAPMQGLGQAQIRPAPMQGLGQAQIRPAPTPPRMQPRPP